MGVKENRQLIKRGLGEGWQNNLISEGAEVGFIGTISNPSKTVIPEVLKDRILIILILWVRNFVLRRGGKVNFLKYHRFAEK